MSPTLQVFLGILAPLLGLAATVGVGLIARSAQRESRVVADLRADVVILKAERDDAIVRERILSDYVYLLRKWIADGKPGPPPPWPDGLTAPG